MTVLVTGSSGHLGEALVRTLRTQANEFLYRRVDIEDVVSAHLLAAERAASAGFASYIISATTPFSRDDVE